MTDIFKLELRLETETMSTGDDVRRKLLALGEAHQGEIVWAEAPATEELFDDSGRPVGRWTLEEMRDETTAVAALLDSQVRDAKVLAFSKIAALLGGSVDWNPGSDFLETIGDYLAAAAAAADMPDPRRDDAREYYAALAEKLGVDVKEG